MSAILKGNKLHFEEMKPYCEGEEPNLKGNKPYNSVRFTVSRIGGARSIYI